MMDFFEKAGLYDNRLAYMQHYENRHSEREIASAKPYILSDECAKDCERLRQGDFFLGFPIQFRKTTHGKERTMNVYAKKEMHLLSYIRYQLHEYDVYFSPCLISHILGAYRSMAAKRICTTPGIHKMYCFKTDVKSYGPSIDETLLIEILRKLVGGDAPLFRFLCQFLQERRCYENGELCIASSPVMQGTPLTSFFENVYLSEFDFLMSEASDLYIRFNDDILVYADSKEKLMACKKLQEEQFAALKLTEKAEKIVYADPGEFVNFLGLSIAGYRRRLELPQLYICRITETGRRMIEFRRMFNLSSEVAMSLMLDQINLLLRPVYLNLPYLTEIEELKKVDHVAQNTLRIVGSMHKDKRRFTIRYKTLTRLGYKSLVCRYYECRHKKPESR